MEEATEPARKDALLSRLAELRGQAYTAEFGWLDRDTAREAQEIERELARQ